MAKKKAKRRHQSFKMTPHGHRQERVLFYIVAAAVLGLVVGYFFKDQVASVLGISTSY